MTRSLSNVPASIRQRLLNRAHDRQEDFRLVPPANIEAMALAAVEG